MLPQQSAHCCEVEVGVVTAYIGDSSIYVLKAFSNNLNSSQQLLALSLLAYIAHTTHIGIEKHPENFLVMTDRFHIPLTILIKGELNLLIMKLSYQYVQMCKHKTN